MELINKTEVAAEIKKRIKEIDEIGTYLSPKGVLTNLLCHLDTLETKEVDLEKEFDKYCENLYVIDIQEAPFTEMYDCAKYFFELGLKTKGK